MPISVPRASVIGRIRSAGHCPEQINLFYFYELLAWLFGSAYFFNDPKRLDFLFRQSRWVDFEKGACHYLLIVEVASGGQIAFFDVEPGLGCLKAGGGWLRGEQLVNGVDHNLLLGFR